MDPKNRVDFTGVKAGKDNYEKMEYKLLPGPNKMLPKVFFSKKWKKMYPPSDHIMKGYEAGMHKKGEAFDIKFCHELIEYFKDCITKYPEWNTFGFKFSPTEKYEDLSAFYKEITDQGYRMSFRPVFKEAIDDMVENGRLFLFQIYNKDFSSSSKGMPNMHTLYWRAAFSEENLKHTVIKLNGEAELFFRRKTEAEFITHEKGTVIVNRRDTEGNPIPDDVYHEIFKYKTGQVKELSERGKLYERTCGTKVAPYDIVKDRRYSTDKMFFHVPITINYSMPDRSGDINRAVISRAVYSNDLKIIGIDRGERNLIYFSMIDRNGKILDQGSLNVVDGFDYHEKLDQRESANKKSRREWTKVENIKELKEGYMSQIVSRLAKMIVDNGAIVVMENLSFGFKRGRFKVEKQVYQKFESMLIDKLNYLVFKDKEDMSSDGRVMRGYQLTRPLSDVKNPGRQSGVIFYIPADYTSKIDPTTGFVNLFSFGSLTTNASKRDFLEKMESIRYDDAEKCYAFTFDYRKYATEKDHNCVWTVYTRGTRTVYSPTAKTYEVKDPTSIIDAALVKAGIDRSGELNGKICAAGNDVVKEVVYALDLALRMRVQSQEEDYIISPVKNAKGRFYCSKEAKEEEPVDSDANGAYNIACKGELLLRMIEENYDAEKKTIDIPYVDSASWLAFRQTGFKTWKSRFRFRSSTTSCSVLLRFTITI